MPKSTPFPFSFGGVLLSPFTAATFWNRENCVSRDYWLVFLYRDLVGISIVLLRYKSTSSFFIFLASGKGLRLSLGLFARSWDGDSDVLCKRNWKLFTKFLSLNSVVCVEKHNTVGMLNVWSVVLSCAVLTFLSSEWPDIGPGRALIDLCNSFSFSYISCGVGRGPGSLAPIIWAAKAAELELWGKPARRLAVDVGSPSPGGSPEGNPGGRPGSPAAPPAAWSCINLLKSGLCCCCKKKTWLENTLIRARRYVDDVWGSINLMSKQ